MISFASDFRYRSACRWLDTLSQTVKTAFSMHTVSDDVTYSVILQQWYFLTKSSVTK